MKSYLVGGAVRDFLLGRPIKDRDWVVVGASPEQLLALGYQSVGQDFPVFCIPKRMKNTPLLALSAKLAQAIMALRATQAHIFV